MDDELKEKVMAFKTIYRAIYHGQDNDSIYKSDFLVGKERLSPQQYVQAIEEHIATKKTKREKLKSKTIQAWTLAQKHYKNCTEDNTELFNEIYKYAIYDTWQTESRLFWRAKKAKPLTAESISKTMLTDHIIFNIYYQLANPIPWGEIWPQPRIRQASN